MPVGNVAAAVATQETPVTSRFADHSALYPQSDRLLRIPVICLRLDISKATCLALIRCGALPSIRIGRALRVSERALNSWIAAGGKRVTLDQYRSVLKEGTS